jgi:regulator of replication initiation timing
MGRKKKPVIDRENLKKVAALTAQMEILKSQLDEAKQQLKSEMKACDMYKLEEEGVKATLAQVAKTTVSKHALTFVEDKKLYDCIKTVQEVDVEKLREQIGRHITEEEFKGLVKETPYDRLTIK